MSASCNHGRHPGKLSHSLKVAQTIVGGWERPVTMKSTVNGVGLICRFKLVPSMSFIYCRVVLFQVWRGRHPYTWRFLLQMSISSMKGSLLLHFRVFLCLLFLKNNQLKKKKQPLCQSGIFWVVHSAPLQSYL